MFYCRKDSVLFRYMIFFFNKFLFQFVIFKKNADICIRKDHY